MRARPLPLAALVSAALFAAISCSHPAGDSGPPAAAAPALESVSPDSIAAAISVLAADSMEGRGTATPGYDRAARWVAARFQALGLEPGGADGGWLQSVPLRRSAVVGDSCALWLDAQPSRDYQWARDYLMSPDPIRERSEVESALVFAGFGVVAPELNHDDYAGLDPRGKIVVLLSGAPATFPADPRAYDSATLLKQRNAAERGAVGILTVRTDADEERTPWEEAVRRSRFAAMRWTDDRGHPHDVFPSLEV
ncbi:MAG TPA: hypothetical protein VMS88_08280, partial [Terriglobales bacterium]|nr:hypothetical protein [Terriglobales bacterium]